MSSKMRCQEICYQSQLAILLQCANPLQGRGIPSCTISSNFFEPSIERLCPPPHEARDELFQEFHGIAEELPKAQHNLGKPFWQAPTDGHGSPSNRCAQKYVSCEFMRGVYATSTNNTTQQT